MVTLELAFALPAVMLVCLFCAWLLRLGQVQAQLDDATRSAARELARGESLAAAAASAEGVLPGVRLTADGHTGDLLVTGRYHLAAPVPALQGLGAHLTATLVTVPERRG